MNRVARRSFLGGSAALAASFACPFSQQEAVAKSPDWLFGWQNAASDHLSGQAERLFGTLPEALRGGTLWRNGPARHERAGVRYQHWFDGDGMIQAFRFLGDGSLRHEGRMIATQKYQREEEAGEFLYPAFGTSIEKAPVGSPDDLNSANISVLPFAGELLALWEAGSAHRINPQSLATEGVKTWRQDLLAAPFSAHPKVTPDGWLWNFGYGAPSANLLAVYGIDSQGVLRRFTALPMEPLGFVHDFAVTERHIVLIVPPFVIDESLRRPRTSFLAWHRWRPELGTRIVVLDKNDFSEKARLETEPFFFFHVVNARDSGSEVIVEICANPDAGLVTGALQHVMAGKWDTGASDDPRFARLRLNLNGRTDWQAGGTPLDFPSLAASEVGVQQSGFFAMTAGGVRGVPLYGAVARFSADGEPQSMHDYGESFLLEEHLFVPRAEASEPLDGWLIGTALDIRARRTVLSILDSRSLGDGPVARFALPYALPVGLHGKFAPA